MVPELIGPAAALAPLEIDPDIELPTRTFSFTQVRTYLTCGACYEARYVLGEPRVVTPALAVGSAVHEALNVTRRARSEGRAVAEQELLEAVGDAYEGALAGLGRDGEAPARPPILKLGSAYRDPGQAKDEAIALAKHAVPAVLAAEEGRRLLAVEAQVDFRGVFPFPFAAYADVMLDDPTWETFGTLKDAKTASKDIRPDEWAAWQLGTYALPWWLAKETIGLGIDQIVKTKVPVVHVWTEPGYSLRPTDDEMRRLHETIVGAADDISAGRFPPCPNPFGCDYPHPLPRFRVVVSGLAA